MAAHAFVVPWEVTSPQLVAEFAVEVFCSALDAPPAVVIRFSAVDSVDEAVPT